MAGHDGMAVTAAGDPLVGVSGSGLPSKVLTLISVVCVYNDRQILEDYLLKSLEGQTAKHERVLLDNTQGRFKSAAEALNFGGGRARGEYIMFVHQDVRLPSRTWLEDLEKRVGSLADLGIAGVAGKPDRGIRVLSNVIHGTPPHPAGKRFKDVATVQTLDECLVVVPRGVFSTLKFDEATCDDWHLYAVDYCLTVKSSGLQAYVLPLALYHKSPGVSFSPKYYEALLKVLAKHRAHFGKVRTTMGNWSLRYPMAVQKVIRWGRMAASRVLARLEGVPP